MSTYEYRQDLVCISRGICVSDKLHSDRSTLQCPQRPSSPQLRRAILNQDFCSVILSLKFSRYRVNTWSQFQEVIFHGVWQSISQINFGQHHRSKRLENLGELRSFTQQESSKTLCKRGSELKARQPSLCIGPNNLGSVHEPVRLGSVLYSQSSSQIAHTFRPQGLDTCIYTNQRRQDARGQLNRNTYLRTRDLLPNRQRIHRLSTSIQATPKLINLRDQCQEQSRYTLRLFTSRGEGQRSQIRSNRRIQRALQGSGVSRSSEKNQISRSLNRTNIDLFKKQYLITSLDHSLFMQASIGDRGVFQMNQTAFKNHEVSWQFRENRQDSNLLCLIHLHPLHH